MLFALLFSLSAYADSMRYECTLYYPASEQGQERFMKVDFPEQGGAHLAISDLTSPYRDLETAGLKLTRSYYSDDDEIVGAEWETIDGRAAVELRLAFFVTYWAGQMTFHQDVNTLELQFKSGEEITFRCRENPYSRL